MSIFEWPLKTGLTVFEKLFSQGTHIWSVKQNNLHKIVIFFLSIRLNMCFWCSKEPSHRDGSFEYPQNMFWLRNKKNNFQLCTLIWRPDTHVKYQSSRTNSSKIKSLLQTCTYCQSSILPAEMMNYITTNFTTFVNSFKNCKKALLNIHVYKSSQMHNLRSTCSSVGRDQIHNQEVWGLNLTIGALILSSALSTGSTQTNMQT